LTQAGRGRKIAAPHKRNITSGEGLYGVFRVIAKARACVLLHAAAACLLAAGPAAAEDARPPAARSPSAPVHDIAARELDFARKAAANGDFRLALSLYARLRQHAPRNRVLREEMEAVASLAPLDVRARFTVRGDEPPTGTAQAVRKPVLVPAPRQTDEFRADVPRSAPEARLAKEPERARIMAPAGAPRAAPLSILVRAPRDTAQARSAAPVELSAERGHHALAKIAAPAEPPLAKILIAAGDVTASAIAAPATDSGVSERRLEAPASVAAPAPMGTPTTPPAAARDFADIATPRLAAAPNFEWGTRARVHEAPPKIAAPAALPAPTRTLAAARPAAESTTPRPPAAPVLAAPAPARLAAVPAESPHTNDARPSNEHASLPDTATDMVAQAAPERRATDADLDRIFDALMRDPGNVELNLRYARAAIDKGEPRKALPAYERVLALDPTNVEAAAGIERVRAGLQPDITQVSLSFGTFYESNPRHFRNHSSHTDAGTLSGRATLFDERRIRDLRWRTEGEAFFTWHTRFHDIDYGLVGVRTGPVLAVGQQLRINPFIGGGYAWLKGRSFYIEATGGVTFEFEKMLPLHSVSVRAGYNDIGQHISTRNAVFVEVAPRVLFPNVGYAGTALWVNPYWRYNGVIGSGTPGFDQRTEPFPARAHQLGVRVDYFMPITSKLTVGVNGAYEYRHFYEAVSDGGKNRRDHFVSPGVQAILTGLGDDRFGIIFLYAYEHRFSNDGAQVYSNHLAGVRLQWRN
jgi:hypothetical protein